nr:hemolymph lipopolysaccharide-binding protein-like [Nomia melanderi]
MYMYLLVVVALASTTVAQVPGENRDIDVTIGAIFRDRSIFNESLLPAAGNQPPIVNLNGNHNYQAAQQVFFISSSPNQWQKKFRTCVTQMVRDDYVITPDKGFHKLHMRKMTWNRARKSCLEEGGQLAVIRSPLAEQYLHEWMKKEKVSSCWLGAHDQFEEGEWVTVEGKRLDYERWSTDPFPYQPDNYGGNQNCAVFKEHGMDDVECTEKHAYICEMVLC